MVSLYLEMKKPHSVASQKPAFFLQHCAIILYFFFSSSDQILKSFYFLTKNSFFIVIFFRNFLVFPNHKTKNRNNSLMFIFSCFEFSFFKLKMSCSTYARSHSGAAFTNRIDCNEIDNEMIRV